MGHSVDIEVFVAVPPQNVTLTMGEERQPLEGDSVTLRLGSDETTEIQFECLAIGARPAPNFKWFLGEAEVKGDVEDRPDVLQGWSKRRALG